MTSSNIKNATLDVVVGGQFGSESKGRVAGWLAERRSQDGQQVVNVRVGGHNAGHIVLDDNGVEYPFRTIPVAAAVDPRAILVIAPGSEVNEDVLADEIKLLKDNGHNVKGRLFIDGQATWLQQRHIDEEKADGIHERLGSTAKGVGASRADRLWRKAHILEDPEAREAFEEKCPEAVITDTRSILQPDPGKAFIVEGTQGYGLGLHAGFYPKCTSNDTRAIDFLSMAGLNPWEFDPHNFHVHVVLRVYPIRVAGNSGELKDETTWEDLDLNPEHTTVTHLVRRVGRFDEDLARRAVRANGIQSQQNPFQVTVALSMFDQLDSSFSGLEDRSAFVDQLNHAPDKVRAFFDRVFCSIGGISTVGTSPTTTVLYMPELFQQEV